MEDSEIVKVWARIGNGISSKVNAAGQRDKVVEAAHLLMSRLVQSGSTLDVLQNHARHDWVWDGVSILRTVYDTTLQGLYVFHDKNERDRLAKRFLDFRAIERERLMQVFEKSPAAGAQQIVHSNKRAAVEPEIQKEFQRVCQEHGIDPTKRLPHDWYKHSLPGVNSLRELAEKTGYVDEYDVLQKQLSAITHSSVFGLDNAKVFRGYNVSLWYWRFAFRVLDKITEYVGIDLASDEEGLLKLSRDHAFN